MRLGVLSESSAAGKNADIIGALEGRGHEIINVGMKSPDETPSLSYIHTSFMAAAMLNLNAVDFIVSGCGTGQGFGIAVNMYPGVFCGHIVTPLDAWLFAQINAGNAISMPMNQGYGWAAEIHMRFIFDRLFEVEMGQGFPAHRREIQKASRDMMSGISKAGHKSFPEVIDCIDKEIIKNCMGNEAFYNLVKKAEGEAAEKMLAVI